MSMRQTTERAVRILERLVAFPSICGTSNSDIADYIAEVLRKAGAVIRTVPGPDEGRVNLLATIGNPSCPGYLFSGHMDVVPAAEADWKTDPFSLCPIDGKLFARGTSDMKGFLACLMAAAPLIAEVAPRKTIHFAFSYDEELGCVGVRHLLPELANLGPILGCIIGEPSNLHPILSHKGKVAVRFEITGRAGHSSRPDLSENAIDTSINLGIRLRAFADDFAELGPNDPRFLPPTSTFSIGTIRGGVAVNVVPDRCEIEAECRLVPGVTALGFVGRLNREVEAFQMDMSLNGLTGRIGMAVSSTYPGLDLEPDHDLARLVSSAASRHAIAAVSYGTEAGLFQAAGYPAIICGPGDIGRAHRANEFLTVEELESCITMIMNVASHDPPKMVPS